MVYRYWAVFVLAVALCLALWPDNASASPSPALPDDKIPVPEKVEYVYRGHRYPPPHVEKARGMPPKLDRNRAPQESDSGLDPFHLFGHDDDVPDYQLDRKHTAYVSTSLSLKVAVDFAVDKAAEGQGWVYRVRPAKNMVDMPKSFAADRKSNEAEYSALGGIRAEQIVDGLRMHASFRSMTYNDWDDLAQKVAEYWNENPVMDGSLAAAEAEFGHWVNPNPGNAYKDVPQIVGHPLLAGLPIPDARPLPTDEAQWAEDWKKEPFKSIKIEDRIPAREYAKKFMAEIGAPNGWLEDYPLFETPEVVTNTDEEDKKKKDEAKEREEAKKKKEDKTQEPTKNKKDDAKKTEEDKANQAKQKAVESANKLKDSSDRGSWKEAALEKIAEGIGILASAAFAVGAAAGATGAAAGAGATGAGAGAGGIEGLSLLAAEESIAVTTGEVAEVVAELNPDMAIEILMESAPSPPTTPPGPTLEPPLLGKRDDVFARKASADWAFQAGGPTLERAFKEACRISLERARVHLSI